MRCPRAGLASRRIQGTNAPLTRVSLAVLAARGGSRDPNDPQVVYYAGNQLNRSTNRGTTWTAISPAHPNDLTGTFESSDRVDPLYPTFSGFRNGEDAAHVFRRTAARRGRTSAATCRTRR
jgi:hypothetical protein